MTEQKEARLLSRDDILAADDLPMERVSVPEWGGDVFVRSMTGAERDQWEYLQLMRHAEGKGGTVENVRAQFLVQTLVDENGERLFTVDDIQALGRKSAAALDRCADVAQRLNGLRTEDVEELAGN